MEYRKDKRTKNLTLRDIHVGDWVQVWSEQTERYSPPLKIIQICDDGTIYLVTSDEERCTPWEEDIKNVDALPMTPELLMGFGFELERVKLTSCYYAVFYNKKRICEAWIFSDGRLEIDHLHYNYEYFHDFLQATNRRFQIIDKLEWKGIER